MLASGLTPTAMVARRSAALVVAVVVGLALSVMLVGAAETNNTTTGDSVTDSTQNTSVADGNASEDGSGSANGDDCGENAPSATESGTGTTAATST